MKLRRVHLVFDTPAENNFDALEKTWEHIRSGEYKQFFVYHFVEKEDRSLGWWGTIKNQLFGK